MGKRPTTLRHLLDGRSVGKKKPKYRNRKVSYDGYIFDSIRERDRYVELRALCDQEKIKDLKMQPKFWLKCGGISVRIKSKGYPNGRRASYTADFAYEDTLGTLHVEDVKGMDTSESRLRRAMVEAEYGISIEIVR